MKEKPETALTASTGVTHPLVLLQSMIEHGADPTALREMMNLAERWDANQARKAFFDAMALCQEEMPIVVKDSQNKHTQSRYASLEIVNRQIKPTYVKHGFALSFRTEDAKEGFMRIVCDLRHRMGHVEMAKIDLPIDGQGAKGGNTAMNAVQGHGSTFEYGSRYLTCKLFNVTIADADTDGNADGPLTDAQLTEINERLRELHDMDAPLDDEKFLTWVKTSAKSTKADFALPDCPQSVFPKIIQTLIEKRKKVMEVKTP